MHENCQEGEGRIKEACGVFGIYDPDGEDVAGTIYYGLSSLRHRGQESCGIAVSDTGGPMGNMNVHRGMGLVSEVFKEDTLKGLTGNLGIGRALLHYRGRRSAKRSAPCIKLHQGHPCPGA